MKPHEKSKKPGSSLIKKKPGKVIAFLHLWLGLGAGLILFTVAVTGCILTFEDELTPIFYSNEQKVEPKNQRLSIDTLVSLAKATYPEKKIFRLYIPAESNRSIKATFGTKKKGYDYVYLNQYDGSVLSRGKESRRFFAIVLNIHRFLLAGEIGKTITGISCAITFFMALSGLYLWWPKNKKILKQRLKVKTDASAKRINWDLHAVGGFYTMVPLIIITFTGLIWSYTWIDHTMFKLIDGKKEKPETVKEPDDKLKKIPGLYETVFNVTNKTYQGNGKIMITFPDKKGKAIVVSKENITSGLHATDQVFLDSRTANVIKKIPFSSLTTGLKLRKLNKAIHTGSVFGWPTKVIAFIAAFITASLPITGFLIWLRRGKRKKKTTERAGAIV